MKKTNNLPFEIRKKGQSNEDLAASLAERAKQTDVDNALALKRDMSIKLGQNDMTPEFLSQMAGNTPINSVPQDDSVTSNKIKGSFATGRNLFNKYDVTFGYYFTSSTGVLTSGTSGTGLNAVSGFIKVPNAGGVYHNKTINIMCYDANKAFLGGLASGTPQNRALLAGTVYVRLSFIQTDIDTLQFEMGNTGTAYQQFQFDITGLKNGFDFLSSVGKTYYRYYTPVIANNTITFKSGTNIYYVKNDNTYDKYIVSADTAFSFVHNTCIVLDTTTKTLTSTTLGTTITKDQRVLFLNIDGKLVAGTLKEQYDTDILSASSGTAPQVRQRGIKNIIKENTVTSTYLSDITTVGNEIWAFAASNDTHTDTALCQRYTVDSNFVLTKVGEFTHNFGHCNSVDYCNGNDTLIMGNGSGDGTLAGQIYLFPNASNFKNLSNVDLNTSGITIDVSSMNWGSKTNAVWADSNNNNNNMIYVITNDNKNIRKIMLGKGSTVLPNGTLINGKVSNEFNGTFKVIAEYSQTNGDDVNQGSYFGNDGCLYVGLGHSGLWYAKLYLSDNGTINKEIIRMQFYDLSGNVVSSITEGITEYNGKLFIIASKDGSQIYAVDK